MILPDYTSDYTIDYSKAWHWITIRGTNMEPSMSLNNPHFEYHLNLLQALKATVAQQPPFNQPDASESDREFADGLARLCEATAITEDFSFEGQQLVCMAISSYPHITPLIPRDLFWFFSGDCLHFMPDEEIVNYQLLDERRFEAEDNGEDFDFEEERAKVFGLH